MRPIWSGAVSFGLVTIPVRLYRATASKRPKFRQLRRTDHSPIRYRKVAEADGEEVSPKDIVRLRVERVGTVSNDQEVGRAATRAASYRGCSPVRRRGCY